MLRFEINRVVKEDMLNIKAYLESQSASDYFGEFKQKIYSLFDNLKMFPLMGTEIKSYRFKKYRFVLVDKYYVFYTFADNLLTIQTILHSARNYNKVLKTLLPE